MKPKFKKIWLWVAIVIIINIIIFSSGSDKFESNMSNSLQEKSELLNSIE